MAAALKGPSVRTQPKGLRPRPVRAQPGRKQQPPTQGRRKTAWGALGSSLCFPQFPGRPGSYPLASGPGWVKGSGSRPAEVAADVQQVVVYG